MGGEIGQRLRTCRKRIGLTQAKLAEIGGVSLNTQHRWETGGGLPSTEYLFRVADAGVDLIWVLTGQSVANDLTDEGESELLNRFRDLPADLREPVLLYVRSFAAAIQRLEGSRQEQKQVANA